jgi:multiple sugar transport system permease protein
MAKAIKGTPTKFNLRRRLPGILIAAALSIYTTVALFPVFWIVGMSFKTGKDIVAYPPPIFNFVPTLENYAEVLSAADFLHPFINTLIVALSSVAISAVFGLPTAYALARMQFKGKENFAGTILSFRFAPELLVVVPLFSLFVTFNLANTYIGLILAYQLITFPLLVWTMRSHLEEVPAEIEEAVLIDGGTRFTAFWMIVSRITLPGLAASGTLAFIYAWNAYALPLVLAGPDTQVITSAILGYVKFADVEWGQLAAGATLSIIPGLIVAATLLRFIIRGMTAGAVK